MDKGRRNELAQLKKRKRLSKYANSFDRYTNSLGQIINKPKTVDLLDWKHSHKLKNHSTLCSCACCSPYKYSRKIKHKNNIKDIC